jgi:hypothetical protein
MRTLILTGAFLVTASAASAQMRPQRFLEIRPEAGAMIPTSHQRDLFDDAASIGLQTAYELKPSLHLVASFGWMPAKHKLATLDKDVNVFSYDVGAEFNLIIPMGERWELKPFLGLGAGARTYDYDAPSLGTHTSPAGYATGGTEFQRGITALRLELRSYLYEYDHPVRDEKLTRNDLALSVGVAFHVGGRH